MEQNRLLLVLLGLLSTATTDSRGAEPNNTWAESSPLGSSLAVSDQLEPTAAAPDTLLGLLDESGTPLRIDDDGSFFGNGLASALVAVPLPEATQVRLRVTGAFDLDFDGLVDSDLLPHPEQGRFEAYATIYDPTGSVVYSEEHVGQLSTGEVVDFILPIEPAWAGGSFDFELNNSGGEAADVDFWERHALPAGTPFVAEVTSADFDSVLGLFDRRGDLVQLDDDSGEGRLSLLRGVVPSDGRVYLVVSAFPDTDFTGLHNSDGAYALSLLLVPEPGSVLPLCVALLFTLAGRCSVERDPRGH